MVDLTIFAHPSLESIPTLRNAGTWRETKFVVRGGRLSASRDPAELSEGSRLMASLVANAYDSALKTFARGDLLDLGCGKAPLYKAYKPYVTSVTCVDWGNSLHSNNHLDHEFDLTQPLPLDSATFQTVILSDVLEHIPTPQSLCIEISRLLSHNGVLLMNVPFYYRLHEQPHDYYRYTEFSLRLFMETAGLSVISIEPIGGALEIISDILSKIALHLPKGRRAAAIMQSLSLWMCRTRLGDRILKATAKDFPFGYFLVARKL